MEKKEKRKKAIGKFFADFKNFIAKGNIIDLAIAVIIGGAFSKIVTSLVNDIIMPLIGLATGGVSAGDLKWVIREAVYDPNGILITAENAFKYGAFLQTIIDFLIISFFIFLAFRIINASSKKLEALKQEMLEKIKKGNKEDLQEQSEKLQEVKVVLSDAQKQELLLTEIRDLLKENAGKKSKEINNE